MKLGQKENFIIRKLEKKKNPSHDRKRKKEII
jgi:hypothetical protein